MDGDSGQEQDMQSHEIDPSSRPLEPQRGGFRGIIDEAKRRFRREGSSKAPLKLKLQKKNKNLGKD